MALKEDIDNEVGQILAQTWDLRDGTVVPATESVLLAGGGVKLKATMLYADLAESTKLAMDNRQTAARVCKAFLAASTRLIRANSGDVRSFDGDRVMGVFIGDSKNTSAAKCALQINWVFLNVIVPKFKGKYESFRNGGHILAHGTGIDVSEVLAVRSGIRNNNDLIWIGRAPNVAAKLSAIRGDGYSSFITGEVYDQMRDDVKFGGDPTRSMWEERAWNAGPVKRVYRSNWGWAP
ncbi:MAG: adenylate/guanylate cyclase domain-containing protein [Pirellulaceae bacterium]